MSILSVDQISPIGSGTTITLNATEVKTGTEITVGTGASIFSPAGNTLTLGTNNTERLRITNAGALGLSGTNYGSSGQVLTSAGSGSAPTWSAIPSQVTINNASGNRVITSDGGTTLNGEDTLRYDGTNFLIGTNTEAPYSNRNLTVAAGGSGSTTVAIEIRSPSNGTGRVIFSDGTSADSSANEGQVIYQQSDHKMLFGVAANYQNMALESTGGTGADLNLIDGNLKFASGHGIDFSASGNAGGMTSELLDDYEEGSWTPTLTGYTSGNTQTYVAQHGTYTKVGRVVTAHFDVKLSNKGNISGTYVLLQGLPFNHAGSRAGTGSVHFFQHLTSSVSSMALEGGGGIPGSFWLLCVNGTQSTQFSYTPASFISNSTQISGTLVYRVS